MASGSADKYEQATQATVSFPLNKSRNGPPWMEEFHTLVGTAGTTTIVKQGAARAKRKAQQKAAMGVAGGVRKGEAKAEAKAKAKAKAEGKGKGKA